MNIFVSSLSFRARREDLEKLFAPFGEVSSARIITDKVTHRSKGYGFVEMSEEDGLKAIEALNGSEHMGRTINVAAATSERTPRPAPAAPATPAAPAEGPAD